MSHDEHLHAGWNAAREFEGNLSAGLRPITTERVHDGIGDLRHTGCTTRRRIMAEQFATIDDYIASFPDDVRVILEKVRRSIRSVVPEAEETMSYQMPTVTVNGKYLVYFAAWKHHIALYAIPTAPEDLERRLAPYREAKDTVKFPLTKPIPYDLIKGIVAFLVARQTGSPA